MELLKQQIEALIFCSEQSISLDEIKASLKLSFEWELTDEEVISAIEEIKSKYNADEFSFELVDISEGYQFLTKKQYHPTISALIQHKSKKKLSVSQMETLAIIAYRQPIAKSEVEHIRGVSCDYAVQKLLEKELIEISGKSDSPGRPVLYSTSRNFMDYFGIKNVKDLPQLKDLHVEGNEIGTATEMMDSSDLENIQSEENQNLENTDNTGEIPENFETQELTSEIEVDSIEIVENDEIVAQSEELVDSEEIMEIPDRKAIYLENEHNVESLDENVDIENKNEEE